MALTTLLALAQAAALPAPPADWSSLPLVQMARPDTVSPADTESIMRVVRRHRDCQASIGPMPSLPQWPNTRMVGLRVDLALLVGPDGRLLNILAAPGPCDAVRDRSRSIVNGRYRGRVRPPEGAAPAWFRTALTFAWEP